MPTDSPPPASSRTEPHRTRPLSRMGSRAFVIGLFLLIVGLAAGQSYYLLSIAESASEMPADSTEATTMPADSAAVAPPSPPDATPADSGSGTPASR